jgi:hypothetical protein
VPKPNIVTVKAQSVQDTSKSGASSATINPENVQIAVSPTSASLQLGGTQKFSVNLTDSVNQSFSWTINGVPINAATPWGTIDSTGLYTAPSLLPTSPVVTLTATSVEDPTKSRPIRVLTSGNHGVGHLETKPPDTPKHLKYEQETTLAQARWLELSSNAKQIFAHHSSEYIQFDEPETVINAVREVYDQARRPVGAR